MNENELKLNQANKELHASQSREYNIIHNQNSFTSSV